MIKPQPISMACFIWSTSKIVPLYHSSIAIINCRWCSKWKIDIYSDRNRQNVFECFRLRLKCRFSSHSLSPFSSGWFLVRSIMQTETDSMNNNNGHNRNIEMEIKERDSVETLRAKYKVYAPNNQRNWKEKTSETEKKTWKENQLEKNIVECLLCLHCFLVGYYTLPFSLLWVNQLIAFTRIAQTKTKSAEKTTTTTEGAKHY